MQIISDLSVPEGQARTAWEPSTLEINALPHLKFNISLLPPP
jgi:hypothetical protein